MDTNKELLTRELLQQEIAAIVNQTDNPELETWGKRIFEVTQTCSEETIKGLATMYEFLGTLMISNLATVGEVHAKSIAAKKLGSSKSDKKALAAKRNAQKAGRHYEYIIFGDNSRILGSATGRKKDELIEKLKQMFIDQSEISLKLASKASDEERKLAREGTIITPTAVII